MEMQQVRYFIALAKTLNFTRAAEQCKVSQPALTRAIQQLERELGGPLFHRERSNTHMSELGQMMLPYLESVETSAQAAMQAAKSSKKLENVTMTLGAMCTIGPQLVADLIVRPLIEPEYSRTIYLATVRGRPHSPAIGAFVKAARRHWPVSELFASQD